jgi:hypothetical protein
MALAPGFAEWLKAEDKRIMDMYIKKFEKMGYLSVEPIIKDMTYYEAQAKMAYKNWESDGFKLGKLREAYMDAHTELANFINGNSGTGQY